MEFKIQLVYSKAMWIYYDHTWGESFGVGMSKNTPDIH